MKSTEKRSSLTYIQSAVNIWSAKRPISMFFATVIEYYIYLLKNELGRTISPEFRNLNAIRPDIG